MSAPALTNRPGAALETILSRALAAGAILVAFVFVSGLVYLLARGAPRLVAFTTLPFPAQIDGEDAFRFALAASLAALAMWGARRAVRPLLSAAVDRALRVAAIPVALVAGLALRTHLPRFLIGMPSETEPGGGIGPELFNTVYLAVLSTAATLPIGIGAAVYMARFARAKRWVAALRAALDTLASLPSIVYGLFGFLVFVVALESGYSLLAGALVLALLNLPLVVGITEESLRAVPRELEEASLALGATQVQTTLRVSLPHAWPGILSAIVLAVGRVFAESAPLIMTAGTTVSRANAYSLDPLRGGETLAVHLWYVNSSGLAPDRAEVSAGTAAVLVALIATTNLLAARLAGPRKK